MNHVSIEKIITSDGVEYQIVREDGMVLATTYSDYYANVILKAIGDDIDHEDDELHG